MGISKLELTYDFILKLVHYFRPIITTFMSLYFLYSIVKLIIPYDTDKIDYILNFLQSVLNHNISTVVLIITAIILGISSYTCFHSKKMLIRAKSEMEHKLLANDKYSPSSNINKDGSTPK